jgi:hypothetical protein
MLLPNIDIGWSVEDVMCEMTRGAEFSDCRDYRSRLFREWDNRLGKILFIMLNPSADDKKEDPTVRRCIGFATRWGYGYVEVRNIFSLRSTDPMVLYEHEDPVGCNPLIYPEDQFNRIVFAWGNHGRHLGRGESVIRMFWEKGIPTYYFRMTNLGQPVHPLYLSNDSGLKMVQIDDFKRRWRKGVRK